MTIGNYAEPRILDAIFNNTSLAIANTYCKLHIGDPGEAGTSNPAAETTRKVASFAAAVGGTIANDTAMTWNPVAATEDYTHVSFWDAVTAGNHLWNGPMSAAFHVNAGDIFVLPIGGIVCNLD